MEIVVAEVRCTRTSKSRCHITLSLYFQCRSGIHVCMVLSNSPMYWEPTLVCLCPRTIYNPALDWSSNTCRMFLTYLFQSTLGPYSP